MSDFTMPRNGSLLHANIYEIRNNGEDDVNISIDRVGEDLYAISRSDQDKIQLADEQFVKNFLTSSGPYPKAYKEMETNNGEKAFVTNSSYAESLARCDEYGEQPDTFISRIVNNTMYEDTKDDSKLFTIENRASEHSTIEDRASEHEGRQSFEYGTTDFMIGCFMEDKKIGENWRKTNAIRDFLTFGQSNQNVIMGNDENVMYDFANASFLGEVFVEAVLDYNSEEERLCHDYIIPGDQFYEALNRKIGYLIEFGGLDEQAKNELREWQDAAIENLTAYRLANYESPEPASRPEFSEDIKKGDVLVCIPESPHDVLHRANSIAMFSFTPISVAFIDAPEGPEDQNELVFAKIKNGDEFILCDKTLDDTYLVTHVDANTGNSIGHPEVMSKDEVNGMLDRFNEGDKVCCYKHPHDGYLLFQDNASSYNTGFDRSSIGNPERRLLGGFKNTLRNTELSKKEAVEAFYDFAKSVQETTGSIAALYDLAEGSMLGAAYLQASIEEHGFNYFEGFDSVPSKQAFYNTVDRSIDIAIQTQGIVSDEYDFRSQEEISQEIEATKQELTEWKEAIQDDVALYNRQADQEYAVSEADDQDFSGADEEDIDL